MLSYLATLLCIQCKCTCDTHYYSNIIHIALVRSIKASIRSHMTLNASRCFDIQCIDVYIAIPQIPIDYHTYIAICQTYRNFQAVGLLVGSQSGYPLWSSSKGVATDFGHIYVSQAHITYVRSSTCTCVQIF